MDGKPHSRIATDATQRELKIVSIPDSSAPSVNCKPLNAALMAPSTFKVIVIGGGPVGITAAHALHHAGIDFVVLERRDELILDLGASLVLGPANLRVLHQFGLLNNLLELGGELHQSKGFTRDGHEFKNNFAFDTMKEK
jgi:hypothetical protein